MSELFIQGSVGSSDARLSTQESGGFDYRQIELLAGYSFFKESLFSTAGVLGYNTISSNEQAAGSHRDQLFLRGSGRLTLFNLLFVEGQLGFGLNLNSITTVPVVPYPNDIHAAFVGVLQGGVAVCVSDLPENFRIVVACS